MVKIQNGLFIIILLISSSNRKVELFEDLCLQKYFSKKWNVNVYHSKDWSPYEFYGNNIGLEYKGLHNLERRYDAEVVITFITNPFTEDEFYKAFHKSQAMKDSVFKSYGVVSFQSKMSQKGDREFAKKKWKVFEVNESGSFKKETYSSRQTTYLWYSTGTKISVKVAIKGKDIKGLDAEVECIINKLEFK
jgi:hypothetical protein